MNRIFVKKIECIKNADYLRDPCLHLELYLTDDMSTIASSNDELLYFINSTSDIIITRFEQELNEKLANYLSDTTLYNTRAMYELTSNRIDSMIETTLFFEEEEIENLLIQKFKDYVKNGSFRTIQVSERTIPTNSLYSIRSFDGINTSMSYLFLPDPEDFYKFQFSNNNGKRVVKI